MYFHFMIQSGLSWFKPHSKVLFLIFKWLFNTFNISFWGISVRDSLGQGFKFQGFCRIENLAVLFGKGHVTPHQFLFTTVVKLLEFCPQFLFPRDRTSFPTLCSMWKIIMDCNDWGLMLLLFWVIAQGSQDSQVLSQAVLHKHAHIPTLVKPYPGLQHGGSSVAPGDLEGQERAIGSTGSAACFLRGESHVW